LGQNWAAGAAVDFGNILDQWEKGQWKTGKTGRKKGKGSAEAPPPESSANRLLAHWLQTRELYDKDAEDPELREGDLSAPERRRRLLARRPDAVIDLHGMNRDQAWSALERFFETARQRAHTKLAIIHGKGNHSAGGAVLGRLVREFIEACPFAGQSGQGGEGGSGTTWVLLKNQTGPGVRD
jgi:DNA-nicking Smr family endonuclease